MEENYTNVDDDEVEIDVGELFYTLLHNLGYIILTGIAFGALALAVTLFFVTPKYTSTTQMYVLNRQSTDAVTQSDLASSTSLTSDYVVLIKSRSVIETVIAQLGLDRDYDEVLDELDVSVETDTRIISISVTDKDPYLARDMANAIREESAEHILKVMNTEAVNVVDVANVPTEKSSPSLRRNVLIAGLVGVVLAIIVVIVRFVTNDKVFTAADIEKYLGLSVLGSLPIDENLQKQSKRKKNRKRRRSSHSGRS